MSEKPPSLPFGSGGAGTIPGGKNSPRDVRVEARVTIKAVEDIVEARQKGRALAQELGFSMTQSTLVATAISELARNIVLYAKTGEIILSRVSTDHHVGLIIIAADKGPGIANIQHALMSGYSSSGGLGLGLPGVRQMVDEFDIKSRPGEGTQVTALMWL
ncbi:MAG TPA: ATP-binding protein [Pseudomonadales bacterium]